jgi:hypothetical protein
MKKPMKLQKRWKNSNTSSEPINGRAKVGWIPKDSSDRNSKGDIEVVLMIH